MRIALAIVLSTFTVTACGNQPGVSVGDSSNKFTVSEFYTMMQMSDAALLTEANRMGAMTFTAYYKEIMASLNDHSVTIGAATFSSMRTRLKAQTSDIAALDREYPNIHAYWRATGFNPLIQPSESDWPATLNHLANLSGTTKAKSQLAIVDPFTVLGGATGALCAVGCAAVAPLFCTRRSTNSDRAGSGTASPTAAPTDQHMSRTPEPQTSDGVIVVHPDDAVCVGKKLVTPPQAKSKPKPQLRPLNPERPMGNVLRAAQLAADAAS